MATTESASNNTITNADSLELGSTLSGGLTSTDVDYFKVSGDDISVDSLVEIVFTPTIPGVGKEWTIDLVNAAGTSLLTGGAQDVRQDSKSRAATQNADSKNTAGLMYPPLPIFACCTDPGPSSPVPPPLFRVFVYCCCDRRHLPLLLSPFLLALSPPPLAFPLPSSFPPPSLVLSSALLAFSLSPSFSSSSPSSTCVSAPASPSFPPGPLPSLPSQLEFSIPQHPSLSHFPSCLSLFAVPSCMVLFLDSALAPKKSIVPYQAACTYRGPLGRPHHAPVGHLASSARSACAMYLIFEASWAVCGKCVHCQFIFSIGDTCTWGCLAHQYQYDIHRRIVNNAYMQCIHTSGKSKGSPR